MNVLKDTLKEITRNKKEYLKAYVASIFVLTFIDLIFGKFAVSRLFQNMILSFIISIFFWKKQTKSNKKADN